MDTPTLQNVVSSSYHPNRARFIPLILTISLLFCFVSGGSAVADTQTGHSNNNATDLITQNRSCNLTSPEYTVETWNHKYLISKYTGAETCLNCHKSVGEGFKTSIHYTWMGNETGKLNGVNEFSGSIKSNEALCGKCHAGYGLLDSDFSVEKIDCLICHAPDYQKNATGPDPSIDLTAVAQRVRLPTRAMCLRCHATACDGDNNKRGDLELAMGAANVSRDLDVHANLGMTCQDCHTFKDHHVAGRGMDLRVDDTNITVACENCHTSKPHPEGSMYNNHTDRLYCTVCHITSYGKVQSAEVSRDWENLTLGADGNYTENIVRKSNPAPIQVWWNRKSRIMDLADPAVIDDGAVVMAEPLGSINDPESKIYAARLHRGRQPWDGTYMLPFNIMTVLTTGDMSQAISDATGNRRTPARYVDTKRYMGIFHGVAPKEDALTCSDCHKDHKLDFEALGYDNIEKDASGNLTRATKPGSTLNLADLRGVSHTSFVSEYKGAETCLACHRQEGEDFKTSIHYTWMSNETGKLNGVNDFSVSIKSNEAVCGKCHAGYGLLEHDFSVEKIDCLICHAPDYKKTATGPDPSIDATAAARNVTLPTRAMCLRCHATACDGDNNKRGDLELAMGAANVSRDLDVHANLGMTCQDCHTFKDHHVAGRGMDLRVDDTNITVSCENCHTSKPHPDDPVYNKHTDRLYCTVCHITSYGKVQSAEVSRDWENLTLGADGKYTKNIVRKSNPAPIQVWWNRKSRIMDLADPAVIDDGAVVMAEPLGSINDPESKIYAARLHRGRQPWDGIYMLPFNIMSVLTTGDMSQAISDATGNRRTQARYVDTKRYMGIFHGVAPKEDALTCKDCHKDHKLDFEALGYDNIEKDASGNLTRATKPGSAMNLAENGGRDCVSCHALDGLLKTAPGYTDLRIDVQAMNKSEDLHYDLNRGAADTLDPNNVRCWACHGDGNGSEAAQPPDHHPGRYKNPRNCSAGDCHTFNQSVFNEPMVYEHFKYADKLDNSGNVSPTANISTTASCDRCHINSIMENQNPIRASDVPTVSHYGATQGATRELMAYPDTVMTDCVYCHEGHYKEDWGEGISGDWGDYISEEWGDATDPTDQESDMIEDRGDEYSRTMSAGDQWELRNGYIFKVTAVDLDGGNARIRLSRNGELLEDHLVYIGVPYDYEREITDEDGKTFNQSDVHFNLTGIMRYTGGVVAIFEGQTIKRIHNETRNAACYACHMEGYGKNDRYTILDKLGDEIYYTTMLVDFSYYDNYTKTLQEGEVWDLGDGFTLTATHIDIDGATARIELARDGVVVKNDIDVVHPGELFYYEDDFHATNVYYDDAFHAVNDPHIFHDLRIFSANLSGVFRSESVGTDLMVLKDVRLISPDISAVDTDDMEEDTGFRLDGYNLSWIRVGDDFGGREPFTLHEAPIHNGRAANFADCVHCHDLNSSMDIKRVDAITSRLGAHAQLNENASNETVLSDPIDRACWACHGTGTEPDVHPDKKPKECVDCHVNEILYGATDLSNETHGQVEGCSRCHAADYPGTHVITVLKPDKPDITGITVNPKIAMQGQLVRVNATATSSWGMKIEAVEYFIDEEGSSGTGTAVVPIDGAFDEQTEAFGFVINTTGLESGDHTVQVHAMERGRWGPTSRVVFEIRSEEQAMATKPEHDRSLPMMSAATALIIGIGAGLMLVVQRKRCSQC